MYRDNTKMVKIGNCVIGGGNKIAIQSMTNTRTENVKETVKQILALEEAGCDIVRLHGSDAGGGRCDTRDKKIYPYSACCRYSF